MNTYSVLKLIHVLSAIVAVGTNVTYFVWLAWAGRHPEQAAYVLPGVWALDARLANPAYLVLPITGVLFSPAPRRQVELATTGAETTVAARSRGAS